MEKLQKRFEDWAKNEGLDIIALAPSDRLYENRWYYEQSTETAYLGWMACSESECRIENLETALKKAREDINWMLNSEELLSPFVFDYIDKALEDEE